MSEITPIAVVGNQYLEQPRNIPGTPHMQAMEWLTISNIEPNPTAKNATQIASDGDIYVTVPREQLIEFGVTDGKGNNFVRDIMAMHKEMARLILPTTCTKTGRSISAVVFPRIAVDHETGDVEVKVGGDFAPYMLQLKEQFVQLRLDVLLHNIHGHWARKVYALCRSKLQKKSAVLVGPGYLEVTIDDLKKIMGISVKHYPEYKIFKREILKPCFAELGWDMAKKSPQRGKGVADIDIDISVIEIKKVRKVVALKIFVTPADIEQPSLPITAQLGKISDETRGALDELGWTNWPKIDKWAGQYGHQVVGAAVEKGLETLKNLKAKVGNPPGLLDKMLPDLFVSVGKEITKKEEETNKRKVRFKLAKEWMDENPYNSWSKEQVSQAKKALAEAGIDVTPSAPSESKWRDEAESEAYQKWKNELE